MENEKLKASVLAKCGELAPTESEYHLHPKYSVRRVRQKVTIYADWGSVEFKENTHEDDDVWPLAAQILGIQTEPVGIGVDYNAYSLASEILESNQLTRPSDALLWEAINQGFIWSGHIKDEREDAWNEWIANVKR